MLTRESLKSVFLEICREYEGDIEFYYNHCLDEECKRLGIPRSIVKDLDSFKKAREYYLSQVVDGMLTDKVIDYINENMEDVPIVSCYGDNDIANLLSHITEGVSCCFQFIKNTDKYSNDYHLLFPNLFDCKACDVSLSVDWDVIKNIGGNWYNAGIYRTYILENGSFAVIEEKHYPFGDKNELIVRRKVEYCPPTLEDLEGLFEERSRGFFV